jgi:hypothetical protein
MYLSRIPYTEPASGWHWVERGLARAETGLASDRRVIREELEEPESANT